MTDHVHDCVIVGAGPAGSAAALQLARDGLDVVFLERGNRPGEKNVMSGMWIVSGGLYARSNHVALPTGGIWRALPLGLIRRGI